jgi:hypothetical protein
VWVKRRSLLEDRRRPMSPYPSASLASRYTPSVVGRKCVLELPALNMLEQVEQFHSRRSLSSTNSQESGVSRNTFRPVCSFLRCLRVCGCESTVRVQYKYPFRDDFLPTTYGVASLHHEQQLVRSRCIVGQAAKTHYEQVLWSVRRRG